MPLERLGGGGVGVCSRQVRLVLRQWRCSHIDSAVRGFWDFGMSNCAQGTANGFSKIGGAGMRVVWMVGAVALLFFGVLGLAGVVKAEIYPLSSCS